MLACDACHASYDYKKSLRKIPAFTATYKNFNGTALASYPDSGETNLCIPCHAGRESAQKLDTPGSCTCSSASPTSPRPVRP